MDVTVCVPAIASRVSLLSRLLWTLAPQDVEVIVAAGDGPMGDKLNACFQAATTRYVVCVDDDDLITPDFALRLAGAAGDFVGYRILWTEDGRFAGSVSHRGDGDTSWSTLDRGVSNKCLIATDLARSVPFGNEYTADRQWCQTVQAQVGAHSFVDAHLYWYDHWQAHMVGTSPNDGRLGVAQRDVGWWPYDPGRLRWL